MRKPRLYYFFLIARQP